MKSTNTSQAEVNSSSPTSVANVQEENNEQQEVNTNPRLDDMGLRFINKDFVYDCMSVPTHSGLEHRLVVFVMLWARRNNVKYEFDEFGNIYLTKGEIDTEKGEYYPCVTSHLDTVQTKHDPYIYANVPLELVTTLTADGEHKISIEGGIGIGADDKGGVCICLSMFDHVDKLKACFFLDEERGCNGSDKLDKDWFKDVGYVIGYDSPDLYRAAWACSGVKLFSYDFYEKWMKPVCDKWGLTKGHFFSEPYTDVKNIREKIGVICMNFGNGGYDAHGPREYSIIEHMDHALGMGIDLVNHIGLTRHYLAHVSRYSTDYTVFKRKDGLFGKKSVNDDITLLEGLGDNTKYAYSASNRSSLSDVKYEIVDYIVERYEKFLETLKSDITDDVEKMCTENGLDATEIKEKINQKFSLEITF